MTIQNRLRALMTYKKLSQAGLAKEIGISSQSLGNYLLLIEKKGENGKKDKKPRPPHFDVLALIIDRFRDIDPQWLILGEGEMLKKELSEDDCKIIKEQGITYQTSSLDPTWAVRDRIKNILSTHNYNLETLSEQIHIPLKTLKSQIEGKADITIEVVRALTVPFPEISSLWFVTGQSNMEYEQERYKALEAQLQEARDAIRELKTELEKLQQK